MPISRTIALLTRMLGLAALLLVTPAIWTQEAQLGTPEVQQASAPGPVPEGVEVLARGPVHEAFADQANGKSKPAPVTAKQPPEPIEELPPDQKPDGDNVQWLPGYWAFDEESNDFLWVSGFWRVPPPGRQWVPGHWNQAAGGWQWAPGFWAVEQKQNEPAREVTYLPPPPESIERGPTVPAPTADHVYVEGSWIYSSGRYLWRPGCWTACRRGWVWVPAHYVWSPCGYVFVEGYWDYGLRERGLLFAPIRVDVAVVRRPGWCYSPCYVVEDDCLVGALFVRPGRCHYYFGDYFEPCHRQAGFVAFYEVGGGWRRDPIFSYYHYHHRHEPDWEISLRFTYGGRYRGEIARPPRTLIQQNTIVQNNIVVNNVKNTTVNNIVVNNSTTNTKVQNVNMVKSINQVNNKTVNLKPVTPEARLTEKAAAQQVVKAAQQRQVAETQALSRGPAPSKAGDAPKSVKLDLPARPTVNAGAAKNADLKGTTERAAPPRAQAPPAPPTKALDPKGAAVQSLQGKPGPVQPLQAKPTPPPTSAAGKQPPSGNAPPRGLTPPATQSAAPKGPPQVKTGGVPPPVPQPPRGTPPTDRQAAPPSKAAPPPSRPAPATNRNEPRKEKDEKKK
ncbi:MAG: YXWGXW repeat-containing protein [Planctomycetia bacterium]|nr:YXWGXW repeat-containing protein [Planctomycetia bacterium]